MKAGWLPFGLLGYRVGTMTMAGRGGADQEHGLLARPDP